MYCIKCGVELENSEKVCPLCGLKVYHPDLPEVSGKKSYPIAKIPTYETVNKSGVMLLLTAIFLVPIVVTLLCDVAVTGGLSWSGFVVGGIMLLYIMAILPNWFKAPNPVIFVPVSFGAIILYLLYIDLCVGNGWFLPFALPATGALGLMITAVISVVKYVKKGYWYVAGATVLAIGGYTTLIEFLLYLAFSFKTRVPWSIYPLASCFIIGITLIVIAISKPLRRSIQKKFFV